MKWRNKLRGRIPLIYALLLLPILFMISYGDQFLYLGSSKFSDLTISHLPNAIFLRRAIMEWGQIPFWSPGILSGFPFLANPLSGLFYPPGWLAVLTPEAWMFNLLAGVHLAWGGLGLALFLQEKGVGVISAVFGGLAFSLMPKLIAHYGSGHLTLVYAVSWTPWLIYLTKINDTSRITYKPAIILAIIFYADVRWAFYAGLLWVAWLWWENRAAHSHYALKTLTSLLHQLILGFSLAAPLALPLVEFIDLSTRSAMSVTDVLAFSLPLTRLLGWFFPEFGGVQEWVIYPGGVVLVLGTIGLFWVNVRRRVYFWWGVFLVAVMVSLGEYLPGIRMIAQLPGVSLLRVPSRAMFLAELALAVLAAYSLDHLLRKINPGDKRNARMLLVALGGLSLSLTLGVWYLRRELPVNFAWGTGMLVLAAIVVGLGMGAWRLNPAWVGFILIGISLIDWVVVDARSLTPRPAEEVMTEKAGVAEFLAQYEGHFRVYSPSYSLPQHTAAAFELELADGVDPLQLADYSAFMARASGVPVTGYSVTVPPFAGEVAVANAVYEPDAHLLGLLNVRFVVAEFNLEVDGLELVERFAETRVYQNAFVLGRAWMADERPVILDWSPNRIEVSAEGPGLLILSEIAYPGWQVQVDGQKGEILVVEDVFRGVQLPDGNHNVVFGFHPRLLSIGLIVFGVSVVAILAFAVQRRNSI